MTIVYTAIPSTIFAICAIAFYIYVKSRAAAPSSSANAQIKDLSERSGAESENRHINIANELMNSQYKLKDEHGSNNEFYEQEYSQNNTAIPNSLDDRGIYSTKSSRQV